MHALILMIVGAALAQTPPRIPFSDPPKKPAEKPLPAAQPMPPAPMHAHAPAIDQDALAQTVATALAQPIASAVTKAVQDQLTAQNANLNGTLVQLVDAVGKQNATTTTAVAALIDAVKALTEAQTRSDERRSNDMVAFRSLLASQAPPPPPAPLTEPPPPPPGVRPPRTAQQPTSTWGGKKPNTIFRTVSQAKEVGYATGVDVNGKQWYGPTQEAVDAEMALIAASSPRTVSQVVQAPVTYSAAPVSYSTTGVIYGGDAYSGAAAATGYGVSVPLGASYGAPMGLQTGGGFGKRGGIFGLGLMGGGRLLGGLTGGMCGPGGCS